LSDTFEMSELGYTETWSTQFEQHASEGLVPGRVIRVDRGACVVAAATGVSRAKPAARLLKSARGPLDLPAVGDWVGLSFSDDLAVSQIEVILERASALTRGDPGRHSEVQVLAANVDVVFVVHPISGEPKLRRIERELALAWDSGTVPVVILTKADLAKNPDAALEAVEAIALGVGVHAVNALAGDGVETLRRYISGNRTAVLIGPSGAGKSTLINSLLGERRQATSEVRVSDGRGRHTTVARELILVPGGGVVIDTPGLRTLGLTGSEQGIASTFPDIERFAQACRYRDCTHTGEPGCAVLEAVNTGQISSERLESYHKLIREAQVAAARTDENLRREEKRRSKNMSKLIKDYNRRYRRG
jgi:ribosome biogenesis GTPase